MNRIEVLDECSELDLRNLLSMVLNRKKLILSLVLVVTFFTAIILLFYKNMYEVSSLIEIGTYHSQGLDNNHVVRLADAGELSEKLSSLYLNLNEVDKNLNSEILSIRKLKKFNMFIEIVAIGATNNLAIQEINKVLSHIQKDHLEILNNARDKIHFEVQDLKNEMNNIMSKKLFLYNKQIIYNEKRLEEYKGDLAVFDRILNKKELKTSSAFDKLKELQNIRISSTELEKTIFELKKKKYSITNIDLPKIKQKIKFNELILISNNFQNTKLVGSIKKNKYPASPRRLLIILISAVTSFIVGIIGVFIFDSKKNINIVNS